MKRNQISTSILIAAVSMVTILMATPSFAQESTDITKIHSSSEANLADPTFDEKVQENIDQWRDLKFGMFIHWGIYSQIGVIESWSLCPDDVSWMRRPMDMSYSEYCKMYEGLKGTFYPVNFDPSKWAKAAKHAGMKYMVFTTKHHDGFNMFDTHQTDYSVTDPGCRFSTDKRANIAKEVFEAFRAEGIQTGAYYSIADWHNDDFWWRHLPPKSRYINYDPEKRPEKWANYNKFVINQLDELTNGTYGDLNLLWFDLCECSKEYKAPIDWEGIARKVRANRPGIMLVARGANNGYENYLTPEQTIPDEAINEPWESCITTSLYSWSYRPEVPYKSTREILDMLVKIVSRGGNLLLNVGPKGDGTLQEEAYKILEEVGDWMAVNSEGIYGTRAIAPYQDGKVYYTSKDGYVYAFYMADADEQGLPQYIDIKSFVPSDGKVQMLGSKAVLKWRKTEEGGVRVTIPESIRKSPVCDHIWALKFKVSE